MNEKQLKEIGEQVAKRGPGRPKGTTGTKRPDLVLTDPGDNTKFTQNAMVFWNLPKVDMSSTEAVQERIQLYLETCMGNDLKPSVAGMAFALGVSRQYVWDVRTGKKGKNDEVAALLNRATDFLESLMIDYMQNGKINPVAGIYLTRNFFGYVDKQEIVVTPGSPLGDEPDMRKLEAKYADSVVIDVPAVEDE